MPQRALVAKELSDLFRLLGHADRIRLVEELREGELDVHTLAETLGLRDARVSQHLSLLRAQRLVEERREGRHVLYHLSDSQLAQWVLDGLRFIEHRYEQDRVGADAACQARMLWSGDDETTPQPADAESSSDGG